MSHHRGPKTYTQDLLFYYDTGNEKSFAGEPTTNLVDARWEVAWGIDGSGQGSLGTRTMINEYHCRIVDVNSNTRQSEWVYGLSPNTTYTFSVRFKKISGAPTLRYQIQPYNGGTYITSYFPTTVQIGLSDIEGWQTASYTITTPANTDRVLWFMQDGDDYTTYTHTFELKGVQVEQKSHATPFTPSTRSNTQSLIDLSRNRTISVSGVSFDSSGMMVFDGTNDAIPVTTPPNFSGSGSWTINTWFKINGAPSSTTYMNVIVDMDPTGGSANMICVNWSDMRLQYRSRPVGGSYTDINGSILSQGVWYNATVVRYGTNETKLFLNGIQDGGTYSGNLPAGNQAFFNIGRWTDGTVFSNATIPIVSIYNRALTADEVFRNYVSLKSRFENIIPKNGMMFHVDANDPSSYSGLGTTWYDVSGNDYDFTLVNSPTFETHNGLRTFNFSGSDDYAIRNGSISHDIGTSATIFVIMASINNSNFGSCSRLVSINDGSSVNLDYSQYFSLPSCNLDKFNLYYRLDPGGLNPTSTFTGVGDPYRILTYSWTANGTAKVYFNGLRESSSSVTSAFDYTTVQRMTFAINAALTLENSYVRISEVIMYHRQMTDEEVAQITIGLKNKYRI